MYCTKDKDVENLNAVVCVCVVFSSRVPQKETSDCCSPYCSCYTSYSKEKNKKWIQRLIQIQNINCFKMLNRCCDNVPKKFKILCSSYNFFILFLFLSIAAKAVAHQETWDFTEDIEDEFSYYGVRPRRDTKALINVREIENVVPLNYNFHEPPPNNGEATKVELSVLIVNVRDIKELNEELSMEMNLRMYWKDSRLSHLSNWTIESGSPFMVLNPMIIDRIWHPDIFIDHVKTISQPSLITKPASLRIYPDNLIRYSSRITASMSCQMDFHYYPADTQYCHVDMKSYAYTNKVLQLEWKEGRGAFLVDKLILPNFDVVLDTTQNFTVDTSSGTYAGIRFTVILRRMLSYHLIQTYLPSTLFIVVSWMSFLVPPESVPGRMALCMTTLLTLTAMFSAVRQNTPNVSYVKALDIWMVVCIVFVFLTLMEYTIILKLKSMKVKDFQKKKKAERRNRIRDIPQKIASLYSDFPTVQFRNNKTKQSKHTSFKEDNETGKENNSSNNSMRANSNHFLTNNSQNSITNNGTSNGHDVEKDKEIYTISSAPSQQQSRRKSVVLPCTIDGLTRYDLAVVRIEKFTSTIIPTMFLIFNMAYWPWLLIQAQYYRHYGAWNGQGL